VGYYEIDSMPVWLLDVVEPDEEFNVIDWLKCFEVAVKEIYKKGKLPIVVGGTGFYIDAILNPAENFVIKPNKLLRWVLNKCSTNRIRHVYKFLDKKGFGKLNNSEKSNRHRLIRKIEIKLSKIPTGLPRFARNDKTYCHHEKRSDVVIPSRLPRRKTPRNDRIEFDCLHVSLTGSKELIKKRIDKRIEKRLKQGLLGEIEGLLKKYKWRDFGMNTLAYREFEEYFDCKKNVVSDDSNGILKQVQDDGVERWRMDEYQYAKRQKVWFKKRKRIRIFDVGKKNYKEKIEEMVEKWLK
ncbi:hypothetical protein KKE45_03750, partial [Patescibacteria group bacterium]|nr:hypothetical protein [Patescibacteria group bacterium]